MAEAGADIVGAHVGLTSGGLIGAEETLALEEACAAIQRMIDAAVGRTTGCARRRPRRSVRGPGQRARRLRTDERPRLPRRLVDRAAAGRAGSRRGRARVQVLAALGWRSGRVAMATVVVVGTLDTKSREVEFVADRDPRRWCRRRSSSTSAFSSPQAKPPTRARRLGQRGRRARRYAPRGPSYRRRGGGSAGRGARRHAPRPGAVVQQPACRGRLDAIIGLGGSSGHERGHRRHANAPRWRAQGDGVDGGLWRRPPLHRHTRHLPDVLGDGHRRPQPHLAARAR